MTHLVTKRLPKMFSTARVLPPSGTVKAFVVEEDCAGVVVEGLSVVALVVVFFFCGLMMDSRIMVNKGHLVNCDIISP